MNYELTKGDRYKDYKGGIYKIVCIATHTEMVEGLAVYTDEKNRLWARPLDMFFGYVAVNGYAVKRFVLIDEDDDENQVDLLDII